MNLLKDDIKKYLDTFKMNTNNNVIFCPSNIYLNDFIQYGYTVGSQDVSPYDIGAYTGDISAKQLYSIGVKYSLVGHSERRKYYQEDNLIHQKLINCLNNDIIPILCIGETLIERENNQTKDILMQQIDDCLNDVNVNNIIIAYEPIWSIGTGILPTNNEIYDTINFIKKYINNKYSANIQVLYGGSVNSHNIEKLKDINNVDGFLIGGSSIKPLEFMEIIDRVN